MSGRSKDSNLQLKIGNLLFFQLNYMPFIYATWLLHYCFNIVQKTTMDVPGSF